MHVAVFAVVEVSIGTPDPLEHFDAETERLDRAQEAQARVAPRLPEVTVHRVILERRDFQTRFSPNSRANSSRRSRKREKSRVHVQGVSENGQHRHGEDRVPAALHKRVYAYGTRLERADLLLVHPRVA